MELNQRTIGSHKTFKAAQAKERRKEFFEIVSFMALVCTVLLAMYLLGIISGINLAEGVDGWAQGVVAQ